MDGLDFRFKLEIELSSAIRSNSTVDDLTDSGTNQKGSKVCVNLTKVQVDAKLKAVR